MMVRFKLTDFSKDVTVEYTGICRIIQGRQGIVAHGKLNQQVCLLPRKCWPSMMKLHASGVKGSLKNQPMPVEDK